jgi:2,4-dienoyl-CoA reductase-like NADH-dependent reductase (Old Yellow Enzyme family)
MPDLFTPIRLGDLDLPNRIFMAPLTRARSGPTRIPNALMAEHYRQRATAGLILSEATVVSTQGIGYAGTPGIWSAEQVDGWKGVTGAVHRAGGHIFLQLWHVGRVSHPVFLGGETPVAPSPIAPSGHVSLLRPQTPYVVPRALTRAELPGIVESFRLGAANAMAAGFDGVEIHGANGYLLDQFLQDRSNQRTDDYGGSIANRARLLLEVTDAVVGVWGASRVGMHLAPRGDAHDVGDSDRLATFSHVAHELGKRRLAFITAREKPGPDRIGPQLKAAFGGVYVANEGLDFASANALLAAGEADAAAFGRLFIANPDLPRRFAAGAPLNTPDPQTFYAAGAAGYTDYPALAAG